MEKPKENKGLFWDHVNKRFYRWHELKLLMQERRLKEEREAAEKEKAELLAKQEKQKKRRLKGLVGQRSLFARAGGRGFYQEGKEID